ncbi:MAG: hypothetical protein GOVbin568_13 [Prokaryotic dsDNA virus sp.]|nr:MAG: hypothetical protein GOVbin568_13 [Prokaryotic dsDNA virus sp.]|tara:strand:- start:407 stop:1180 length:774 start_codon:yes stop_codon:yes gene_type:complete
MPKKLHTIKAVTGEVTFVDDAKGGEATAGTRADCLAYGFEFRNSKCFTSTSYSTKSFAKVGDSRSNNIHLGKRNDVTGSDNYIQGNHTKILGSANSIYADNTIILGTGVYSKNKGEIAYGFCNTKNRSRNVVAHYNGTGTRVDNSELFIGGYANNRYEIDESYSYAITFSYQASVITTGNLIWCEHGIVTYKYVSSTLTEISHSITQTHEDSGMTSYSIDFDAVAGTPDYIKLTANQNGSHVAHWTVTLNITETRYA